MNREIKFRGKSFNTEEWVYGTAVLTYGDGVFISDGKLLNNDGCNWKIKAFEVVPESVGQFMEVSDKKGIEVYDGDIVEFRFEDGTVSKFAQYLITYGDDGFYLKILKHNSKKKQFGQYFSKTNFYCYEIIGNKINNPELLKSN